MDRTYANFISMEYGLITCEVDGRIEQYIQREVGRLTDREKVHAVRLGMIPVNFKDYKEFPRNYSLVVEDPEVQGKPTVTFSKTKLMKRNGTYSKI